MAATQALIALLALAPAQAADYCESPANAREQAICEELSLTFADAVEWERRAQASQATLDSARRLFVVATSTPAPALAMQPQEEAGFDFGWLGIEVLKAGIAFGLGVLAGQF